MLSDPNFWVERLSILIPLWISLSVHEWAHAFSAFKLGDATAAEAGRMTVNPLAHIDPVGTLLLPLMGVPFGWAKPVPIDPRRFHKEVSLRKGIMISAAAGPAANLILAAVVLTLLALGGRLFPQTFLQGWVLQNMVRVIYLNVVLAVFNMIPVPPLDGSRVADGLMPKKFRPLWNQFLSLGPILLIVILVAPSMLGIPLFGWLYQLVIAMVRLAL